MCYHYCRTACFEGYCPSGWTWKRLYRISLRFHACPGRFIRRQNITRQTNGIQLVHRRNLDGIAPVWVAGVVGIKASGALLESIPSAASASELPVSAAAARISSGPPMPAIRASARARLMPRLNFMVYSSFSHSAVRWNEPRLQKRD